MVRNDLVDRGLVFAVVALILTACAGPAPTPSRAPGASASTASPAPVNTAPIATTTAAPSVPASAPTSLEPTTHPSASAETSALPSASAFASLPPASGNLRWYCCLGTGEDPHQQDVENQIAADWTAANPGAKLTFEAVTYDQAYDQLSTEIRAENAPDIVGPAGVSGIEFFHGQWLDQAPLIAAANFDLSAYAPNLVDFFKTTDGQVGVPLDVYPSVLWYSRSLFDEAGLNYPPHKYGDPYTMPDGSQVEWNYDTIRTIGLMLTVDENGNDATSPEFNAEKIEQWGFDPQRDDLRYVGSFWAPGSLVAADGTTASIPEAWKTAWKYFYNGMWTDHFIMTGPKFDAIAEPAGGYAFFSGRVAMTTNYLWITYGLGSDSGVAGEWDIAALPAYNGQHVSPLNADTFGILKGSKNPESAFQAVTYLVGDRAPDLLAPDVYGGMPAATDKQQPYLDSLDTEFSQDVDWQVVSDSLQYPDLPNSEGYMPKYSESVSIMNRYLSKWTTTPGLDLDAEIADLQVELQTAWNK